MSCTQLSSGNSVIALSLSLLQHDRQMLTGGKPSYIRYYFYLVNDFYARQQELL